MSEELHSLNATDRPDSAVSAAMPETDNRRCNENCANCSGGNCDVHYNDIIEPAVDSATGDLRFNENWTVHSTDKDCDVHSNESCSAHSNAGVCDAHFKDALFGSTAIPTLETAEQLQKAFDYLNSELFENKLPHCLITYQRRKSTYGYFAAERFGREDGERTDEIALNPQHFAERTIEENLSTLAHEMVHLRQHHFGKPGRGRYHNKQWADMMEAIGLIPSSTGKEGGKRTGDHIGHYIKPGGLFAHAVEKLLATGFALTWREVSVQQQVPAGG
jgi:predicted SprT family Zn-dependent metalloprotease